MAAAVVVLPLVILIFMHLGSVVDEGEEKGAEQNVEVAHRAWKQKCWSCRSALVNMVPLTSIKIVVTVWQIISQVRGRYGSCRGVGVGY